MNIEEMFPDGEWKSEKEYVIRCPFCGDHPTHNHCHVNVKKKVFFCHYEGCKGTLRELLKKCEITGELESRKKDTEEKKYELIDFSQFPRVKGDSGVLDGCAYDYLTDPLEERGRGLNKEEIEIYDFRFSGSGRFFGRVLVPIYEDHKVVNFVARRFLHRLKEKYIFPHTGETLLTSSEAIFGYEEALKGCAAVMVTEGVFDAIAANRVVDLRGVAILSSHLSKGQLYKLLRLPKDIDFFVCLDSDAHKKTLKIAKELYVLGRKVKIILLKKGDPASISRDELVEAMNSAEPYSLGLELRILMK